MLWWARQDSNLRPRDYESPALPLRHKPISCDILFNCQIALDRATFLSKNDTQSFFFGRVPQAHRLLSTFKITFTKFSVNTFVKKA